MAHSETLTSGWSVQRRNPSSAASPCSACPSAQKCSGRNTASARPESRWNQERPTTPGGCARASRRSLAYLGAARQGVALGAARRAHATTAHTARSPIARSSSAKA